MNKIDELVSIVEFAHVIRPTSNGYQLEHRSIDRDKKYVITAEDMDLVHPELRSMVHMLARRPGAWGTVSGEEALSNIRRTENPTVIITKRQERFYVAELTNAIIKKGIVQLNGEIYRVERHHVNDGQEPKSFYANGVQSIGKGFSIGIEQLSKQYPDFRERLDFVKSLELPPKDWAAYLFVQPVLSSEIASELPADASF